MTFHRRPTLPPTKAPTLLTGVKVGADAIDEWYGITVTFTWTDGGRFLLRGQRAPDHHPAPHAHRRR